MPCIYTYTLWPSSSSLLGARHLPIHDAGYHSVRTAFTLWAGLSLQNATEKHAHTQNIVIRKKGRNFFGINFLARNTENWQIVQTLMCVRSDWNIGPKWNFDVSTVTRLLLLPIFPFFGFPFFSATLLLCLLRPLCVCVCAFLLNFTLTNWHGYWVRNGQVNWLPSFS